MISLILFIVLGFAPVFNNTKAKQRSNTPLISRQNHYYAASSYLPVKIKNPFDHQAHPPFRGTNIHTRKAINDFVKEKLKFLVSNSMNTKYHIMKSVEKSYVYERIRSVLDEAFHKWQGTPYLYGGTSSRGIDCSALVQRIFQTYFSKHLPRNTHHQLKVGKKVPRHKLRPGDLVFFDMGPAEHHVGIMINNKEFLDSTTSYGVKISSLKNNYWSRRYLIGRRILSKDLFYPLPVLN